MPAAEYVDAVVYYRTKFPTLESLGEAAATWKAELDVVAADAFDSVSATGVTLDGGSVTGFRNFDAKLRVRALHAVRAELDAEYVNPYTQAIAEPIPSQRMGSVIRFGL